jgi:hypothetical protein
MNAKLGVFISQKKQQNITVHRSAIDEHIQFSPIEKKWMVQILKRWILKD